MAGYICIWEFRVEPGAEPEFERHYGPEGTWAKLFRRAPGYIEAMLLKDCSDPLRYLTIDRWRSAEFYREFRVRFASPYKKLDEQCESLTTHETWLGEFAPGVG